MKYLLLFILSPILLFSQQDIVNKTDKPMLCVVSYPSVYEIELIHDIEQRVQVEKQESYITTLPVDESLTRKRDGNIVCYNEIEKISSYKNGSIKKVDGSVSNGYVRNHEMFDISSYANENKEFIDAKYGASNQCKEYKGGEYCKITRGLDILYTKAGRVKKIFIYGPPLFDVKGNLTFEIASFNKIRANSEPLGLWISKKNKKIIHAKPNFESENVIIWKNPTSEIKQVVMTAKNGHKDLNNYSRRNNYQERSVDKNTLLKDYLQAIEIEYVLNDKAYELHQKSRPMPKTTFHTMQNSYQEQNLPRKAKTTWGAQLNPKNIIPTNKFKAFYINTNKPKKVIASQEMDKVSINYNSNHFHNIDSKDFGGYWVGNFTYKKTEDMQISISQSWAKTRIIIDGMVIYEGTNNGQVPFTFTKGKHKIEVEFINNWHTTNFMVNIQKKEKKYTSKEIKKELKRHTSKNSDVFFVGVYESKKNNQTITLKIAKHSKPVILVLSSYDSVGWIIKNPHKVKIEAIVYSAHKPGVEVKGDISDSTPILAYNGRIGSYSMEKRCSCINGGAVFNCDGQNGLDTIRTIENLTLKKMFGYSVEYGADTFIVPNTLLNTEKRQELKDNLKDVEKQRKECQAQSNPEFENIFNK
ncbi:hypothetical protein [Sulfurimonas sp.]|uniref:hypothetical protein n=1 Tax=Sulfurimonas sp. TaxID=2022749 RepID=UPI00356928A2